MEVARSGGPGPNARFGRRAAYGGLALLIVLPLAVFAILGLDATSIGLGGAGGPAVAFSAGVLSFVSPCVLPIVPIYVANLAGASFDAEGRPSVSRGKTFSHALAFIGGLSAIFILLGVSGGLIGYALVDNLRSLEQVAGVLMILLAILIIPDMGRRSLLRSALLLAGMVIALIVVVELAAIQGDTQRILLLAAAMGLTWAKFAGYIPTFGLFQRTAQFNPGAARSVSYTRSSLIGGAFALGWTPCVGPILGGIFTLAATSASAWTGAYLLGFYALGFSIPFLVTALAVEDVSKGIRRVRKYMPVFEVVSAIMLIMLGMLLLTGRLTQINNFFGFAEFNQGL